MHRCSFLQIRVTRTLTGRGGMMLLAAVLLAHLPCPAAAQPAKRVEARISRAEPGEAWSFVQAAEARHLLVSEADKLVIVSHREGAAHDLSLFALDGAGEPGAEPVHTLELPRAAPLKAYDHIAVSMVRHPDRPLLYVWQDIVRKSRKDPQPELVHQHLDHLLVYAIEGGRLTLKFQGGRGEGYAIFRSSGSLVIDAAHDRLFLPNMVHPARAMLGYCRLDADGMPLQSEGALDEYRQTGYGAVGDDDGWPYGVVPASETVAIIGGYNGPSTWDMDSRGARINRYVLELAGDRVEIAPHPEQSVIYASTINRGILYAVQHARGYLTLLPRLIVIHHQSFETPPIVMPALGQLAVGQPKSIYLVALNETGGFTGAVQRINEARFAGTALGYGASAGKLYVAVTPEPAGEKP